MHYFFARFKAIKLWTTTVPVVKCRTKMRKDAEENNNSMETLEAQKKIAPNSKSHVTTESNDSSLWTFDG
jgi:hypothetical protein